RALPGQPPRPEPPYWSQVLRALREARGVSREVWADFLGYGRATVQRWERGAAVPDAAAEAALLTRCQEWGLFRRFDQGVLAALRTRRTLLVLDNCEHLLGSCARLVETLLRAAADLRVVVTSREPLGIAGEQLYRLPSLRLPGASETVSEARLYQWEALQLF